MEHKTGDLVWVDLGHSYGKWPATYQIGHSGRQADAKIINSIHYEQCRPSESSTSDGGQEICYVKFFDDDSLEKLRLTPAMCVEPYMNKNRLKYVRAGVKKHREKKGKSVDGANLKLAQFLTDVEMSEVLSGSNDAKVAAILQTVAEQIETAEADLPLPESIENIPIQENQVSKGNNKSKAVKKSSKNGSKSELNKVEQGKVTKQKDKQTPAVKPRALRSKN